MTKPRRKPSAPPALITTDTGPDTPAQRHGAVYEQPKGARAAEGKRKTRQHPLERMAAHGALTDVEKERGLRAVDLYCATLRSQTQTGVYVDRTPDYAQGAVLACEALFAYARAVRNIPPKCRRAFDHVIEEGRYMETLRGCRTNKAERRRQVRFLRMAIRALVI